MRQAYKEYNPQPETMRLVSLMNHIITSYTAQGFKLSVRQLYYQLVARDLISNTEQSYKRIASILNDARLGGYIDWDAIEDRNRDIEMQTRWRSGADIVDAAARSFHMDMWDNQFNRLFVIVEKAALAGVLGPVCRKYDVPLLAARGYPSVSIVRELVLDHMLDPLEAGQCVTVLHLGDHDPSGIDMTRDLKERIELFAEANKHDFIEPSIDRIALTMKQIVEKKPPPNPAKATDARFNDYKKKFGEKSWELDALEPAYLANLVDGYIDRHIDQDKWAERREEVEDIRKRLTATAKQYRKG